MCRETATAEDLEKLPPPVWTAEEDHELSAKRSARSPGSSASPGWSPVTALYGRETGTSYRVEYSIDMYDLRSRETKKSFFAEKKPKDMKEMRYLLRPDRITYAVSLFSEYRLGLIIAHRQASHEQGWQLVLEDQRRTVRKGRLAKFWCARSSGVTSKDPISSVNMYYIVATAKNCCLELPQMSTTLTPRAPSIGCRHPHPHCPARYVLSPVLSACPVCAMSIRDDTKNAGGDDGVSSGGTSGIGVTFGRAGYGLSGNSS